jgi:hypothetical protein
MFTLLRLGFGTIAHLFCFRRSLLLENLALRQQLAVFKRRHPRPRLNGFDKLFWVTARQIWSEWKNSPIVVTPETVVGWHQAGFRLYWKLLSRVRQPVGRKRVSKEIRDLIFRMVAESRTCGAPRIHGELLILGVLDNGDCEDHICALDTMPRLVILRNEDSFRRATAAEPKEEFRARVLY